ncbi:hypothetical protein [Escherichia coli]|uniref:hypothetical protein n=1 Tax=Escherichia coli TaxID=562 RepID=UPI00203FC0CB|nr:hypothetical protein [Escherichia coli]
MPTYRAYKQQRPTRGLYDTITFYHPSFGYVRLVDKQFFPKTLGGQEYTPARFEIEESQQSGTPVIDATVKLGRLSSDVKLLMKKWKGAARLCELSFWLNQLSVSWRKQQMVWLRQHYDGFWWRNYDSHKWKRVCIRAGCDCQGYGCSISW